MSLKAGDLGVVAAAGEGRLGSREMCGVCAWRPFKALAPIGCWMGDTEVGVSRARGAGGNGPVCVDEGVKAPVDAIGQAGRGGAGGCGRAQGRSMKALRARAWWLAGRAAPSRNDGMRPVVLCGRHVPGLATERGAMADCCAGQLLAES